MGWHVVANWNHDNHVAVAYSEHSPKWATYAMRRGGKPCQHSDARQAYAHLCALRLQGHTIKPAVLRYVAQRVGEERQQG